MDAIKKKKAKALFYGKVSTKQFYLGQVRIAGAKRQAGMVDVERKTHEKQTSWEKLNIYNFSRESAIFSAHLGHHKRIVVHTQPTQNTYIELQMQRYFTSMEDEQRRQSSFFPIRSLPWNAKVLLKINTIALKIIQM